MRLRKAFAIAVVSAMLGLQLFAELPPTTGNWYWPFINYPMYPESHHPGDTFTFRELHVVPCGGSAHDERSIDARALHVPWFRFSLLLEAATGSIYAKPIAPEKIEEARLALSRLIDGHHASRFCRAEVWTRTFTLGTAGVVDPGVPWQVASSWPIASLGRPVAKDGEP